MTPLLPEASVAAHLTRVLEAASDSGLPRVWRAISPEQARKMVLSKISPADAMTIDHTVVHDSYWLSKRNGPKWWPSHMAEIIMDRNEARYNTEKQQEAQDAQRNQLAKSIASSRDSNAEHKAFCKWRDDLTPAETRAIISRRKAALNIPDQAASAIPIWSFLKSEWEERASASD